MKYRKRSSIIIFRIVQEAFHNIAKYSGAEWVDVSITKLQNTIQLSIEDHGIGFDLRSIYANRTSEKGFGLMSMRERTELSGGIFEIESKIGEGTRSRPRGRCLLTDLLSERVSGFPQPISTSVFSMFPSEF